MFFNYIGLGTPLAFVGTAFAVAAGLSNAPPEGCKDVHGSLVTIRASLQVSDGQPAANPIPAVFMSFPGGLGLYSDADTPCQLLASVGMEGGRRSYESPKGNLFVVVGPLGKLMVVQVRGAHSGWRETR